MPHTCYQIVFTYTLQGKSYHPYLFRWGNWQKPSRPPMAHLFTPQVFIEHLLHARDHQKLWNAAENNIYKGSSLKNVHPQLTFLRKRWVVNKKISNAILGGNKYLHMAGNRWTHMGLGWRERLSNRKKLSSERWELWARMHTEQRKMTL